MRQAVYRATFERAADGTWVVALVEEPNVHAYGATLVEARRNIRDTVDTLFGPFGGDGDGFELVEDVRLPESVLAMVGRARLERHRANQQRATARAAEEQVAATVCRASAVTREAARLLQEHAALVLAQAGDAGQELDVRLPEAVLALVEQAHSERLAAHRQREEARAASEAAGAISDGAVASNQHAARLLVEECGLDRAEAAELLGLSAQRVDRLLGG